MRPQRCSRPLLLWVLGGLVTLAPGAAAWVPELDTPTARAVVDSAYDRLPRPVPTLLTLDLTVGAEGFAADTDRPEGDEAGAEFPVVRAFAGGEGCLDDWRANPNDFERFGSRPTSVTLAGQADEAFVLARRGRDAFRNVTAQDVLAPREGALPAGHLRVYVGMRGLANERQRDAYTVALRTTDGEVTPPYRRAFTTDWTQDASGRWSGTMVYYFDALKAGADPEGTLDVLIRTEADTDCAYAVTADLARFR